MKLKKALFMMAIAVVGILGMTTVSAATISDNGQYSLVLTVNDENGDIDGEYAKIVRFDIDEGETTVKLSELAKDVVPFNGENEFSHWVNRNKEKVNEDLLVADFNSTGCFYKSTGEEVNYTNGLTLEARFEGKALNESDKYYVVFDGFAGTLNNQSKLRLDFKKQEFQNVDLIKYVPVRKGYTFIGWDLDGKIVTTVDSSAFANDAVVTLTATYTKDTFDGADRVLILNANGGTISGNTSNKYDYLGGGNSGTAMSLLPYIPVREGYTFNGWNSKKDGSGKNYKYIYWRLWDNDGKTDVDKDTIITNQLGAQYYQNVTLYASWTKNAVTEEDTVKEINSNGDIKSSITFEKEVSSDYVLDIKNIEVKDNLTNKDVKYVVDINVLENGKIIKISDLKMKIRIALPEELKGFDKYEVVYISDDKIKETIPATIENGYIVFETSHLSQYGIVATRIENTDPNPETGDNIVLIGMIFMMSMLGILSTKLKILDIWKKI